MTLEYQKAPRHSWTLASIVSIVFGILLVPFSLLLTVLTGVTFNIIESRSGPLPTPFATIVEVTLVTLFFVVPFIGVVLVIRTLVVGKGRIRGLELVLLLISGTISASPLA